MDPDKRFPLVMSVEKAGTCILKGLRRKRRIITFDWRYRLMVAGWRLIPRGVWERLTCIKTRNV